MELKQAIKLVRDYLTESEVATNDFGSGLSDYVNPEIKFQILSEYTKEYEFGWVFYYDSVKHIQTGDFRDVILGNAPLIVDRNTGQIITTGTARETDFYIQNYIKNGDPHDEV